MKISIPKRIELEPIIGFEQWKDTYIIVRGCGADDVRQFTKFAAQNASKTNKLKREKATHEKSLINNPQDVSTAERIDEIDALLLKSDDQMFGFMVQFVEDRFMSGRAFDDETQKIGDLVKEDIKQFDVSILKALIDVIAGTVEKKI